MWFLSSVMLGRFQISSEFKFIYHYHNVLSIVVILMYSQTWLDTPPTTQQRS